MRLRAFIGWCCAFAAVMAMAVITEGVRDGRAQAGIDPAEFSATVTNKYLPLSTLGPKVFEGTDTDSETGETIETRLESRVLPETTVVAGVTVTVLEEKDYEDGELVEVALDYFAQHMNGDVYYFGERVDNYEDGSLKDHAGQWLTGEDGAIPGIYIAKTPEVGRTYAQELAPGIAEDKSEVLAVGETVTVPAGPFSDCVKTRDFSPLDPGVEETKWHCAGVGLVKEEGAASLNELASVESAPEEAASPTSGAGATSTGGTKPAAAPATGTGTTGDDGGGIAMWVGVMAWAAAIVVVGGGAVALRAVGQRR